MTDRTKRKQLAESLSRRITQTGEIGEDARKLVKDIASYPPGNQWRESCSDRVDAIYMRLYDLECKLIDLRDDLQELIE